MTPTPVQLLTQTAGAALARADLIPGEQAAAALCGVAALEAQPKAMVPSDHRAFRQRMPTTQWYGATVPRPMPGGAPA